jgi:hypothetical protein
MVERVFNVAQDQMNAVGQRSRRIAEERYPEITWEHSHVVIDDDGHVVTFCVYGAPDEEVIRRHAQDLGDHQVLRIAEIAGDVTPADFPS